MLKSRFLNMLENQRSCKLQYNLPLFTNEGQVERGAGGKLFYNICYLHLNNTQLELNF